MALIEHLPEDAALVAELRGGRQWRGWTRETGVLADLFDAVNLNTVVSGRWRRHPPKIPPYPRPDARPRRRRPMTIDDIAARYGAAAKITRPNDTSTRGNTRGVSGGQS